MSNRKRRTAPRVLGALAAAGALCLAAPDTIASACPEHGRGSDSGGQSSTGATSAGAGGANSAGSTNRTGAKAQKANNTTQKANNTTSKPPAAGGQDSTTACSGNSGRPGTGPCGTDLN